MLGRVLTIRGQAATIVAVMPRGFGFPAQTEVWPPARPFRPVAETGPPDFYVYLVGRLAPGATVGDAYLQDFQVRQFRSQSTARGRIAHLTAFFGRAARAAALTTYQIRQYQLARRAAGAATNEGYLRKEHRRCARPAFGYHHRA